MILPVSMASPYRINQSATHVLFPTPFGLRWLLTTQNLPSVIELFRTAQTWQQILANGNKPRTKNYDQDRGHEEQR